MPLATSARGTGRWGTWTRAVVLFLAASALALYTRAPCFETFFYDDILIIPFAGEALREHNMSWFHVVTYPWAGNYHPAWLLHAYGEYLALGLDQPAWHFVNTLYHVATAVVLFAWLRRVCQGSWGPALAALVWAASVGGFHDDPAVVLFEAHYPLALFWLLLAYLWDLWRIETGRWGWSIAAAAAVTVAIAYWEVALFGVPTLALQAFLLAPGPGRCRRLRDRYMLLWLATFLLNGGLIAAVLARGAASPSMVIGRDVGSFAYAVGRHFAETAGSLFAFIPGTGSSDVALFAVLALVLGAAPLLRARHWKALVILGAMPVGTILAVCLLRDSRLFYSGDYLYYVLFLFSVYAGLVVDAVIERWPAWRATVLATSLVLMVPLVQHQRAKAIALMENRGAVPAATARNWSAHEEQLRLWAETASSDPIVLPTVPLCVQPERFGFALPVHSFARIADIPGVRERFRFVLIDRFSPADRLRLESLLDQVEGPKNTEWRFLLETLVPELASLAWAAEAFHERGAMLVLPESFFLHYPQVDLMIPLDSLFQLIGNADGKIATEWSKTSFSARDHEVIDAITKETSPAARHFQTLLPRMRPR